jgi:hypothetical protein
MITSKESKLLKTISAVTLLSLMMSLTAIPSIKAASLTDSSDTMADSSPSATSSHDFDFTTGQNVGANGYINIAFHASFSVAGVALGDINCPGAGTPSLPGGQVVRCTFAGGLAPTTTQIIVGDVVSPAKVASAGVADTYTHTIITYNSGGTPLENAQVMVAIIDLVTVTASVDATLQFEVSGLATSTVINQATTTFTTTSTTIPFGVIAPGAVNIEVGGQQLEVTTNADYGFVVTVEQDQNLTSAASSDIDSFDDGSPVSTPKAWESPTGTLGNENEYGHMGLTSDDSNLSSDDASYPDFSGSAFGGFNGSNPYVVFAATSSADGSTQDIGMAKVAYQIEITSLQEAGDYTNTLMYICTPSY